MINKIKTICLSLLLAACGGGGTEDSVVKDPTIISPQVPQEIPVFLRDPPSNTLTEPTTDHDWIAVVRWQGPTNLTFKQLSTDLYESTIDTRIIPFRAVIGGGPHNIVTYTRAANPQPIATGLKFTWQQSIRDFWTESLGIAQFSLVLYLRDNHNNALAMVLNSYESRPSLQDYQPFVASDTYTMFFSAPIKNSPFMTTKQQQVTGLTDSQEYQISLTRENFVNILNFAQQNNIEIKSKDPNNWSLTLVGLLHETFRNDDPAVNLRSQVNFSTVKIEKLPN